MDPFAGEDDSFTEAANVGTTAHYYHIRIQQRNGRKTLTTLQGLEKIYDGKKMLKELKKSLACNGNVVEDEEMGQIIQLQGDHRNSLREFLVAAGVDPGVIVVHGF